MPSILEGVDELIDERLGIPRIGRPPQYRHKGNALRLGSTPQTFDAVALVRQILFRIEQNCNGEK